MAKDLSSGGKGQVWSEMARNYDSTPTEQRTGFRRFNKSKENESKEKEVFSVEDLDADLESYLAQRTK